MYYFARLWGESTYYIKGKPDSDELASIVHKDLSELLGISAEPIFSVVSQHSKAMAQYQVGHQQLVSEIDELANGLNGIVLAGNAYHGIGIPDCIHSGEQAAMRLLDTLS